MSDYRGILGYAQNAINSTPQVRDNPQNAELIAAIQSGDAQKGIELANQILKQNGVTKGQALQRAFQFFNLPG